MAPHCVLLAISTVQVFIGCVQILLAVFFYTLTVNIASSNDVAIEYLKNNFSKKSGCILDGKYFHMQYCAHILNIIVKDGINEVCDSISRICGTVKYFRSSPGRVLQFQACVDQERITSKTYLVLDVSTRWNSTYLMLETALKNTKKPLNVSRSNKPNLHVNLL